MSYSITELAQLAGTSTRTLRFYEQKGLLKAHRNPQNNYRYYDEAEVDRLQKILFLRLFDLPLDQIKKVLDDSEIMQYQTLAAQRQKMILEQQRLADLITSLDKTLASMKGVSKMSDTEKFAAFKTKALDDNDHNYGQEIRTKYGEQAVSASYQKYRALTRTEMTHLDEVTQQILTELRPLVGTSDLDQEAAKHLFELHREFLQATWPSGLYSPKAHRSMAAMYVVDDRFSKYYEKGTGKKQAAATLKAIIDHYA